MKINLAVSLDIQKFDGSGISDYNSGCTNTIINKRGERFIATQRPSIDVTEDSSTISALNDRGRGIYYWETNSKLYIVHDNDVYAVSQDTTPVGTITAGTEAVTMLETIGTPRMVILDAENDEGWVMSTGETVTQIASNFPSTLAHGGAILNSRLIVMDEDGIIYSSDVDDPTTFNALAFIEAERENDKGVYLGKHHDHVFSIGTQTVEFFYDADTSTTTGSNLLRRQDIAYNTGGAGGLSVWENGDITYFLGSEKTGQIKVYKLERFNIAPISDDAINSFFTQGLTESDLTIRFSGLSAMGHDTLLITVYTKPANISPLLTLSYDTVTGMWGFWNTELNSLTSLPLMAWTRRTGGQNATVSARKGEGILYNGDIISINDRLVPTDTLLSSGNVYEPGCYEDGCYTQATGGAVSDIPLKIRTGLQDFETRAWKFQASETLEMESTSASQTMTIKHSDEVSNNFDGGVTIDTSLTRKEAHQGGRFMKRNWQLEYQGDEQVFLESLDVDLDQGL